MRINERIKTKPVDLLQAYRVANTAADMASNLDEKIKAYDAVINFCFSSRDCLMDDSTKRNMVMYWTYNNIGDALVSKNAKGSGFPFDAANYTAALKYYEASLQVARDDAEKMSALQRMADTYKKMGDKDKWLAAKEHIIEYMDDGYKRRAYAELAEKIDDGEIYASLYEKALNYVTKEEVSVLAKCQNTLEICDKLKAVYRAAGNKESLKRLSDLSDRTAFVAINALAERVDSEQDRNKRLSLFAKILELEEKYLGRDAEYRLHIYRQLEKLLEEGDVLNVNGIKYSKDKIHQMLKN